MRANAVDVEATPSRVGQMLLRPREAAKALAISERLLWTLTKRGAIRAVKLGRCVRYDISDLRRGLEELKAGA